MSSVGKIIEISADSNNGFDEALEVGIKAANESVRNVRSVWVKDKEVLIENGSASLYRVHLKVTFVVE